MLEAINWSDLLAMTLFNMMVGGVIAFVYIAYDVRRRKREEARDLAAMQRFRVGGKAQAKIEKDNDEYYKRFGR